MTDTEKTKFDLTVLTEDSIEAICSQLSSKDQGTLRAHYAKRSSEDILVPNGTDLYNALSLAINVARVKYDPRNSVARGREYDSTLIPGFIKYVYDDFTADEMRQIGLNLLFNTNLDMNQILEWCLHLANHVPSRYLTIDDFQDGWKNVETINKIKIPIDEEGNFKRLKKVTKPELTNLKTVNELKNKFEEDDKEETNHEQRAWFRMKDNEVVCYFPVLFFSVLRSKMGLSKVNYINRLKRVNGIMSIIKYSEREILTLPDDHVFFTGIFIEKKQAELSDKIQDIMAKCIYLFIKSKNVELGLMCGSLVARNAAYMGLSHYAMYKVLYDSLPEGVRDWIIPACRVPNKKGHHDNFVTFLIKVSEIKDDFWPFIRAVDSTVFGQYSVRCCISTVLSLAMLCDAIVKGDDEESAYAGYSLVYNEKLDQQHIAYLNKMIAYFKSEINDSASNRPLPLKLKKKAYREISTSRSPSPSRRSRSKSARSTKRRVSKKSGEESDSESDTGFEAFITKSN